MTDNSATTHQSATRFASKATRPVKPEPKGEWLYLQQAAELLDVSEKTLRRYIKKEELKARKGKAVNAKIEVFITDEFRALQAPATTGDELEDDTILDGIPIEEYAVDDVTDEYAQASPQAAAPEDFSPRSNALPNPADLANVKSIVNELMDPLLKRIEEQSVALNEQQKMIRDQQNAIRDQEIQLRLLPDLKAREENERKANEQAELENAALKKQIEALAEANEALKQEVDKKEALLKRPLWKKFFGINDPA
jgi:hypothetical protein